MIWKAMVSFFSINLNGETGHPRQLLAAINNHKTSQTEGKPKIAGNQSQENNRKIELDFSLDRT